MRKLLLLGLLLVIGTVMAPYVSSEQGGTVMDVGEEISTGTGGEVVAQQVNTATAEEAEEALFEAEEEIGTGEAAGKNMNTARVHQQLAQDAFTAGDYDAAVYHAEEAEEAAEQSRGIAAQVQEIVVEKKNGTLEVSQGQVVSIIAQTHVVNASGESIPLDAALRVRVRIQEEEHVLVINSAEEDELEIEENGIRARTRQMLTITNEEMFVGENQSQLLVLPAELPERARLSNMSQIQLALRDGTPYYEVTGMRKGKVLWLIDVELPVQARVHAQTGNIENEQGPWWAFLVTSQG